MVVVSPPMSQSRRRLLGAGVALAVIVVDQASKFWAQAKLADEPVDVLPTVQLDLAYNDGMSFGTGSGFGAVIGAIVILVLAYLVSLIYREPRTGRVILLAVVAGGAAGNLLDRLFRAGEGSPLTGAVVDFIDVEWYAVFNIADAAVVLGLITFVLIELFGSPPPTPDPSDSERGQSGPVDAE
jgi:signal peptidase II